jgi:DNA-3-methyladenine glycosylase II
MRLTIHPTPPFNFDLSAQIFLDGDRQIRSYADGRYRQVIRLEGPLALATITSTGPTREPRLSVELASDQALSRADANVARRIIRRLFNLDFDLKAFYADARADPVMSRLARRLRGLKSPTTATVFEALVSSIIEQQISLVAAHSMERRVIKAFGAPLTVNGVTYYAFPAPGDLAAANPARLRACGLSHRKAEYVRDIARLIVAGRLDPERFRTYEDTEKVIQELCQVRGVGVWTAELTALRGLRAYDAFPADDLGLRRVVSRYYANDRIITSDQARRIAGRWDRWKGLAGYYLIVAAMRDIEI